MSGDGDTGRDPAKLNTRQPDGHCQTCGREPVNGTLHAMPGASPPVREHCGGCVGIAQRARFARGRR